MSNDFFGQTLGQGLVCPKAAPPSHPLGPSSRPHSVSPASDENNGASPELSVWPPCLPEEKNAPSRDRGRKTPCPGTANPLYCTKRESPRTVRPAPGYPRCTLNMRSLARSRPRRCVYATNLPRSSVLRRSGRNRVACGRLLAGRRTDHPTQGGQFHDDPGH